MDDKSENYSKVAATIQELVSGENDPIAVMSTIACELFHGFEYFHWVGFYRMVDRETLKVGPYQGGHGCLSIDINRGVCGACVRNATIQIENDVSKARDHIACSAETKAEIVLPIYNRADEIVAVLDIDSTKAHVFDYIDVRYLQEITRLLVPLV